MNVCINKIIAILVSGVEKRGYLKLWPNKVRLAFY